MTRHSFWVVPALALAMAAPAMAKDNEKEKNQNRVRREIIYGDRNGNGGFWNTNDANMRFRGMDRNGDGMITRGEWRGSDRAFRNEDLNRDGVLSGREVWANGRSDNSGYGYGNRDVYDNRDIYSNRDSNRDVYGNRDIYGNGSGNVYGDRSAFGRLDRNNDGVLEGNEWPYGASAFSRLDRNGNRVIESWEYRLQ